MSDSREYDGALVSLRDAVKVAADVKEWLIVGGHMVNLHIVRSKLRAPLRFTRDADLALELRSIRKKRIVPQLREMGYDNHQFSNRFDRTTDGVLASIDIIVPSYTTKHEPNIDAGDIAVDGMPVLDAALEREPVIVDMIADMTTGERVEVQARIPDVVSAIAMKSFAIAERANPRDAEDLANLLECAELTGNLDNWPSGAIYTIAGRQLAPQFDTPGTALQYASPDPERQTRLRAITRALLHR